MLSDSIWREIDEYCKYAEIGGTIGAKRSSFVEAAAQLIFEQDAEFQEYKKTVKPQKKVIKKDTPSAATDNNVQQKKEEIKKETTQIKK